MALVGQEVSEKKIFEIVDGRTDGRTTDGRTDDGRTPDHGHPISSPCEPNGSGELKNGLLSTLDNLISTVPSTSSCSKNHNLLQAV